MARYNKKSVGTKTVNLAGGNAYSLDAKTELATILLTSFMQDQFYRSAGDTQAKLKELLAKVPPDFAAKTALFARREYGMRSITHVVGAEVAHGVKKETWTKRFLSKLFKRPDDMLEVVSYYADTYGLHPLPNCLKKALRTTLSGLSEYQLAKYRGEGKSIKMVDIVNLVHPKHTSAIGKLIKGTLKSTGTWEAKLTKAGQEAESDEDKVVRKAEAWAEMLKGKKLGYLALIRNIRNILEQAPGLKEELCAQLKNAEAIKNSLVFPFQIAKAKEIVKNTPASGSVLTALDDALEISVSNVPVFEGKSLVCIDISGSMSDYKLIGTAALFGAVLARSNNADIIVFNDKMAMRNVSARDSTANIAAQIVAMVGGGTNWTLPLQFITQKKLVYDRIIYLSDAQSWIETYYNSACTNQYYDEYCKAVGKRPAFYSIDLQGYGSCQMPQNKVFLLAGFSEKIFDVMKLLETDRQALVHRIEQEEL